LIPWITFAVVVLGALAVDLGLANRSPREMPMRAAIGWMIAWVTLAALFNVAVYFWFGAERALEFTTAYLVEEALSVDNMFVFYLIFSYFAVPKAYQHRVLFWGIVGAVLMRGAFIAAGTALLSRFHWLIYVFGAFLVYTGVKLFFHRPDEELHPERNPVVNLFRRWVPLTREYVGHHFLTVREGKHYATPLLLALVMVETTDVVFAVDSIPAVFAISRDPFIVFTSNIFAVLGLRALYFVLAGMIGGFRYLHYGLAVVLAFIGVKMLLSSYLPIPAPLSLAIVAGLIGFSVAASLLIKSPTPR
jgi:tellurite resistance protein TerC